MPLRDLARATLDELPRSPLIKRATVVDVLLDMMSATEHPDERVQLEQTLQGLPQSLVVDRTAVADILLDLLSEKPSPN